MRAAIKFKVLEVPKRTVVPPDEETRASIRSLEHHIGFKYLMAKLAAERAVLENRLTSVRMADLHDYHFLQSGVLWSKFFEAEVQREIRSDANTTKARAAIPFQYEKEAFDRITSHIELVGTQVSPSDNTQ